MDALDNRMQELETQLAFLQQTVDALNDVVTKQWAKIERQEKLIQQLDNQVYALESQGPSGQIQERPPHY